MTIGKITLIRQTSKAVLISWYDTNHGRQVKAWVPKSVSVIENGYLYLNNGIYNNLKFI